MGKNKNFFIEENMKIVEAHSPGITIDEGHYDNFKDRVATYDPVKNKKIREAAKALKKKKINFTQR